MGIETGIDLDKVIALGRKAESMVGHRGNSFILVAGKSKELLKSVPAGQQKTK
jgi:hydroxymethylglutaryl-CoA lyase